MQIIITRITYNSSAPKPSWIDTIKIYVGNDKIPKKQNRLGELINDSI